MDFEELLRTAVKHKASDIHIQALSKPMLRIGGKLRPLDTAVLTHDEVIGFISSIVSTDDINDLNTAIIQGMDFSHTIPNLARFRCSAHRHLGNAGIVLRIILEEIPTLEELNLPTVIRDVALSRRGLTLVTGATGSGKSTTLAAMIDLINSTYRSKIITIEDPIEYVYANKKSLVTQLEVGIDTPSYAKALRQALRQDPDTILVGELRDVESLRTALHAADTGHQVFSTVHSTNAPQTIERIIAMFPLAEHKLLLSQLAGSIEAIISQRLLTTLDGGRRPAIEILRGSGVTEKFIMENNLEELRSYMEKGEAGMQSFDQHILQIFNENEHRTISGTEAMRWSSSPEALAMAMRGIKIVKR
ncbi:MAG: type IV pilus twitching motility protein PilT [Planctomycetota bacterium]|jgi:twitching motility protein PilT